MQESFSSYFSKKKNNIKKKIPPDSKEFSFVKKKTSEDWNDYRWMLAHEKYIKTVARSTISS